MSRDIVQYAFDVKDTEKLNEEMIEDILTKAGLEVYGVAWKARWTDADYHDCKPPYSCD